MNPRFEELRKRLIVEPAARSDTVFARNSQSAAIERLNGPRKQCRSQRAGYRRASPQPAEPVAEQKPDNEDAQMATDVAKATDERTQIIPALFEPAPL